MANDNFRIPNCEVPDEIRRAFTVLFQSFVPDSHLLDYNHDNIHEQGTDTTLGAMTEDINLNNHGLVNADHIDYRTAGSTAGQQEGRTHWNPTDKTLNVDTGIGPVLQAGFEDWFWTYNDTGVDIPDGCPVHPVAGATDGRPHIELAIANTHEGITRAIWVTTMPIPNGTAGIVTQRGTVRGLDTSMFNVGDNLWVSPESAGSYVTSPPAFPDYRVQIGGVAVSHATDGEIVVSTRGAPIDTIRNFWNGTFRETFDFRITSSGSVITGSLSPANGHPDMTMMFSDGFTMLSTDPAATIVLTPGTDSNPQTNFIYIPKSTKVLTVSTSDWPVTVEHIKVAQVYLQTAATTEDAGALRNQNWNDAVENTSTFQGHLSHLTERIRQEPSKWHAGAEVSVVIGGGDEVWVSNTSGVVYQMHRQVFPVLDMETGDDMQVANDFTSAYAAVTDLSDITLDAVGDPLNNTSFCVVVWGVCNKTGEASHLMLNMPTGTYNKNFPETAIADASARTVYAVPNEFNGVAFLLARLTFVNNGGTWSLFENKDLRGQYPNTSAGGGGGGGAGVTTFTALIDTPSSYVGQALKHVQVNAAETGTEFVDEVDISGKVSKGGDTMTGPILFDEASSPIDHTIGSDGILMSRAEGAIFHSINGSGTGTIETISGPGGLIIDVGTINNINVSNSRVKNLGAGTADTDAVNKGQMDAITKKNQNNIMLNAFRIAINGSLSQFQMQDGVVDEYEDETGVDVAESSNETYSSIGKHYQSSPGVDLGDELISQWAMNDDAASTAVDDSQDVNEGTATRNTSLFSTTGKISKALDFNGSSDWVSVGTMGTFGSVTANSDFSIAFWMKTSDTSSLTSIMGTYNSSDDTVVQVAMNRSNTGDIDYFASGSTGGGATRRWFTTTSGGLNDGAWHHVVINVGSSVANSSVFVDSVSKSLDNKDDDSPTFSDFQNPMTIGARNVRGSIGNAFDGVIDDMRIYSKILLQPEIDAIYNSGNGTESTGVVGSVGDMVLVSTSTEAESIPVDGKLIFLEEDVDAVVLNTDLKAWVSRDDGTTYSQITLVDEGDYDDTKSILVGNADISAQPSDKTMRYKLTTHNSKSMIIHGTGLLWD